MISSNSTTTAAVVEEVEVEEGEEGGVVEGLQMEVEGEVLVVGEVAEEDAMEEEAVMEDEKEGEAAMESVVDEKVGEVEEGAEGEDLQLAIANLCEYKQTKRIIELSSCDQICSCCLGDRHHTTVNISIHRFAQSKT